LVTHKIDRNSTDDKLRSSFHLYDGVSNQVMLICSKLKGEKNSNKVITCTPNGKLLKIIELDEIKDMELATFDIVDLISNITVISKRSEMDSKYDSTSSTTNTNPNTIQNEPTTTKKTDKFTNDLYSVKSDIEGFTNTENFNDIDRMELYQYVDSGLKEEDFIKEYNENTNNNQIDVGKFKTLSSIDAAFDKILDIDATNDGGENMFMQTIRFNKHLYDADNGLRDKLRDNKDRIQNCIDNLNKMMIQDMARDYNFLQGTK